MEPPSKPVSRPLAVTLRFSRGGKVTPPISKGNFRPKKHSVFGRPRRFSATNGHGGVPKRGSRLHLRRRAPRASAPRCPFKIGIVIFRRVFSAIRRTEAARNVKLSSPAVLVRPASARQLPGNRAVRISAQRPRAPPQKRSGTFREFFRGNPASQPTFRADFERLEPLRDPFDRAAVPRRG